MGAPNLALASASGRWLLAVCALGSSLTAIDGTLVLIALPAIGGDLDVGFATLQWVMSAYMLTFASIILLGGVAGDQFGRRRVFVGGVVWFAAASVLCAVAPSASALITGRVLQGVGAALVTPAALAVIQSSFRPADRARAVGAWAGLSGVAAAVAPLLGGWILDVASWRWVFGLNPLLAVIVIVLTLRYMPETHDRVTNRYFDLPGAVLCLVGLGALTYATIAAADYPATNPRVIGVAIAATAAMTAFWWWERHTDQPMLPRSLFSSHLFNAANAVTFVVYAAINAFLFLVVIELQVVVGFSALLSGSALVPITVLILLLSTTSARVAERHGPRLPMTLGPLVCAVGVLLGLRLTPGAGYALDVLPALTVFGLGLAIMVAPLTETVLAAVGDDHAGAASGVNNAVARTSGLLSIAALPVIVGLTGETYTDPHLFLVAFRQALLLCAAALLVGAGLALATIRTQDRPGSRPAAVRSAP